MWVMRGRCHKFGDNVPHGGGIVPVWVLAKRVVDAYVLWTIKPEMRLRVTASNLLAQDAETVSMVDDETTDTLSPTFLNWRVQLELKL